MQLTCLALLVLPALIAAVPCTDPPTGAPPTGAPPTNPPVTNAPTNAPTNGPTNGPTGEPTFGPTDGPTAGPTEPLPPAPRSFPNGTYGLPMADTKCPPASGFKFFLRYWDTEDYYNGNRWPATEHFNGFMKRDGLQMAFCVKSNANSNRVKYAWPAGDYCIVKKGNCPDSFEEGSLFWDDEDDNNRNTAGKKNKPDGVFNEDTQLDFCCRNDGAASAPIRLPTRRPFYLMRYTDTCQQVYEMDVTEEVIRWDDEDGDNDNSKTGAHPMDTGNDANHELRFCYYSPPATA